MIFHMPDDVRRRGLREIVRVVRDGGTILVVDTDQPAFDALGRSMAEVSFVETGSGTRKVARLAPSVRYLRMAARKDPAATGAA